MTEQQQETETQVVIQRQWDDYRPATIPLGEISDLHWDRTSGGVKEKAPQFFVHGYVQCTKIDGDIAHSCRHGDAPHSIKVCLVKKYNSENWDEITEGLKSKPEIRAEPYRESDLQEDVDNLMDAIRQQEEHEALDWNSDGCILKPRNLDQIASDKASEETIAKRSKRMRRDVRERIEETPNWEIDKETYWLYLTRSNEKE